MQNISFHPRLILRTPHEAFSPEINETVIREYIQNDPVFREALYLASPCLFAAFKSDLPEKLLFPLTRYIIRNRYRATPFGLFSGVSTVQWGRDTRLSLQGEWDRYTRFDMDYLCTFARKLERDPLIREHLIYYPNSSLYLLGEEIRYVERAGTPVLNSVKNNPYVAVLLEKAASGADFSSLLETLRVQGASREEARAFLHELAEMQLIVSELEPRVTGDDFSRCISRVLDRVNHPSARAFREIRQKLTQLDRQTGNDPALYAEITELIRSTGVAADENKLFNAVRVNFCKESAGTIDREYQEEILRVIRKLHHFASGGTSAGMKDFISRFHERYEGEEIPLLTALDTESGIGYPAHTSGDYTPLTEGITLPPGDKASSRLKWKELQQVLFRSLQKAQQEGAYEIPLPFLQEDSGMPDLGPTFAVMFRLVDDHRMFIESIGGSSGTQLAGRFGHASGDIAQILQEITREENKYNPGIIFAEIVHLPESRTGNILSRPTFRDYEIPYLAQSCLPTDKRILLQDLYVSVRDNRVILRHRKLNKIVIPRLGCAHNFRNHSLPVYRFLCDLQTQDFHASADFSWGEIAREFVFLPRVSEGRVIISPAMWQFSSGHLEPVQQPGLSVKDFERWRKQYRLPLCFILAEGDNELFINSSNSLLRRVFLDSIREKSNILIKEFLGDDTIPVRNAAGRAMVNQFITFLIRNEAVYDYHVETRPECTVQRAFSLGSEWVYLKFYCGAKSADLLLQHGIHPIVREAEANGWIDQWFFIRYHDPENHLRVRFHLTDTGFLQNLLRIMDHYIQPFEQNGLVWKIKSDTYRRELERYGYGAIEPIERLFNIDSRMFLDFLGQTEGDQREDLKWLWGLGNIDLFLHTAGLNTRGKKALIEKVRNQFAQEFRMDRNLKSQIDRRYRTCRKKMEEFLKNDDSLRGIPALYEKQLRNLWEEVHTIVKGQAAFERILISCIHMTVNRLISSGQRLHELVMYDFLCRHYTSQVATTL